MADWVAALLDKLEISQAALVGHSMGALIALDLAGRRPERVRALALLGVAERMPVHPDLQAAADRNEVLAAELVTSWGHARRGQVGGHPAPGLWMAGGAVRLIDRASDGVLAADLAACNAYDQARVRAAAVRCSDVVLTRRRRPHDAAVEGQATDRRPIRRAHYHAPDRRPHDDDRTA